MKKSIELNGVKRPIQNGRSLSNKQEISNSCNINSYCLDCIKHKEQILKGEERVGYSDLKRTIEEEGIVLEGNTPNWVVALYLYSRKNNNWTQNFTTNVLWDFYLSLPENLKKEIGIHIKDSTSFNHSLNKFWIIGLFERDGGGKGTKGNKNYIINEKILKKGLDWFFDEKNKYIHLSESDMYGMYAFKTIINKQINKYKL